jgi:hypothetical protein
MMNDRADHCNSITTEEVREASSNPLVDFKVDFKGAESNSQT